tara:strand:+ start:264 stop:467 length:204 start_codon:yes stop_codon:yes gene_type:complete
MLLFCSAGVAQLVEHLTVNQRVVGSSPASSVFFQFFFIINCFLFNNLQKMSFINKYSDEEFIKTIRG